MMTDKVLKALLMLLISFIVYLMKIYPEQQADEVWLAPVVGLDVVGEAAVEELVIHDREANLVIRGPIRDEHWSTNQRRALVHQSQLTWHAVPTQRSSATSE